jgi:surface antigen
LASDIDFTKAEYNEKNNFKNNKGQCTWFVDGRVQEVIKKKLKFSRNFGRHAKNWIDLLPQYKVSQKPLRHSIAVFGGRYGHVVFVENVTNKTIWFREANIPTNNKVDAFDGRKKVMSIKRFENRFRKSKLLGYIKI